MRKILMGALLGAAAMYYLDPASGPDRRRKISGLWAEQKDTVLEATRSTAGTVTSIGQGVGDVVGSRFDEHRAGADSGDGNALTGSGRAKGDAKA